MKIIDKLLKLSDEADEAFRRFEETDKVLNEAFNDALNWFFGSENSKFRSGKAELSVMLGTEERAWVVTACPDITSTEGWVSATDEELYEAVRKVFSQLDPCVEADLRFAIDKVKRT